MILQDTVDNVEGYMFPKLLEGTIKAHGSTKPEFSFASRRKSMTYPSFVTRAIVFTAPEKAEVVEGLQCGAVDDDSVVIKSRISGLSRGMELDLYTGAFHDPSKQSFPLITGCEPVGEAVFVGRNITHLKEGDRVFGYNIFGGFPKGYTVAWGGASEYVVFSPETFPGAAGRRVVKVPDSLDDEHSVFGCLPAVAYHGVKRVNPCRGSKVAVIGLRVKPMFSGFLPVGKAQEGYQRALREPDKYLKIAFTW